MRMENHPSNGRRAMEEELTKGRDIANHLLEVLVDHKPNTHEGSMVPFVEDLVLKVLCSFTNTLLLLNTNNDVSNEVVKDVTSSVECPKPQDRDEASKSSFGTKIRRGCYKRKRSSAPTWETNSSILTEDGYVWRKYGQKMTMNAKYLRSYYRCTHKYDEGCPAIKHVQRIQEDPPLYRTTYYGHHNCKTSLSPEIMLEHSASSSDSSMFLSFSDTFPRKEHLFSSSLFSSTKEEPMEVIPEDNSVHNQLPSSDYLLLCDYELDFNYSRHDMLSSNESVQFDYGSSLDFYG